MADASSGRKLPDLDFLKSFSLGSVTLRGRVLLAPLAGYGDRVFRRMALRFGAALAVTEMVSARALLHENLKSSRLMRFSDDERPVFVQLFGGEPSIMGDAAGRVARDIRPDGLDINFGCPVRKIVGSDAGSVLMKDPERAGRIISAMVKAVDGAMPVTVKTRAGFDTNDGSVYEMLRAAEEAGAAALTVHARTRAQMFKGQADWGVIAQVKSKARIPVIGNGDVKTGEDAARLFQETGCDAVMVGRASMGAPWVFQEINHYLTTGEHPVPMPLADRLDLALEHYRSALLEMGERLGRLEMRKHLVHYLKGFQGAKDERAQLVTMDDPKQVIVTLECMIRAQRERGTV